MPLHMKTGDGDLQLTLIREISHDCHAHDYRMQYIVQPYTKLFANYPLKLKVMIHSTKKK